MIYAGGSIGILADEGVDKERDCALLKSLPRSASAPEHLLTRFWKTVLCVTAHWSS